MDRRAFIAGAAALALAPRGLAEIEAGREVALVTADLESRLVAVDLETGRVRRYVPTLPRPEASRRSGAGGRRSLGDRGGHDRARARRSPSPTSSAVRRAAVHGRPPGRSPCLRERREAWGGGVLDVITGACSAASRSARSRVTSRSTLRAGRSGSRSARRRRRSPSSTFATAPAPALRPLPAAVPGARRRLRAGRQTRLGQLRRRERAGALLGPHRAAPARIPADEPPQHFTFSGERAYLRERRERNAPRPRRGRAASPADAHPRRVVQRPAGPRLGRHARSRDGDALRPRRPGPHRPPEKIARSSHDACIVLAAT